MILELDVNLDDERFESVDFEKAWKVAKDKQAVTFADEKKGDVLLVTVAKKGGLG